jgi:hypothetical protein
MQILELITGKRFCCDANDLLHHSYVLNGDQLFWGHVSAEMMVLYGDVLGAWPQLGALS